MCLSLPHGVREYLRDAESGAAGEGVPTLPDDAPGRNPVTVHSSHYPPPTQKQKIFVMAKQSGDSALNSTNDLTSRPPVQRIECTVTG